MNNAYIPRYRNKSTLGKEFVNSEKIMRIVEEYFEIDRPTILMRTKKIAVAYPRQVCIHLLAKHSVHSLRGIAVIFGFKDSGSAFQADKAIRDYLDTDDEVRKQIAEIEALIN